MKVEFENGVSTYSGKYKEVVYQSWLSNQLCLVRKYAYPTLGEVHQNMSEISQNLNSIYLAANPLYLADFKTYAAKNARENVPRVKQLLHPMPTSKSLFIRCMWEWHLSDPGHIDLKTVTIADIITLDSTLRRVVGCVEAGYLKKVSGYNALNNNIQV
ncbi:MAG: hypothetical protein PHO32_05720 [Candidatus Cloacimonetes bacterium]|nr:hypothetical protein [Candidatus Cloacimonadota bacterium]